MRGLVEKVEWGGLAALFQTFGTEVMIRVSVVGDGDVENG